VSCCCCLQLVAMDALFSEPDNSEHKQRRSSLKAALIKSVPKPDGLKAITAITTARGALLQLADYALWQFFCGSGGSGSSKLNMSNEMPIIYNIVLVVIQRVMNVTDKEAATALSTCLKNTKNRASAKKYLQQRRCVDRKVSSCGDATESAVGGSEDDDEPALYDSAEDASSEVASAAPDDSSFGSSVEPDSDKESC